MDLFFNFPLFAALTGIIFAQLVKIPIHLIATKEFKPGLAFSTGGMPSSHSAAVAAVTTSIGLQEGFSTGVFAVSCVFSIIIMFDASGVRRQTGEQAILLNTLVKDFSYFVEEAKVWGKKGDYQKKEELKELLGHQPIEVFFGALTGIILALVLYQIA
ncbi:divergent PAP2 family protein [Sediminibacillus albus]|uniref:Divergent PAP2 family protein n=1 Tax=Sediminibacillus albus TaxID=407036 RepID=A0A1G8YZB9_9BACI|nr:divergent PAP2 family protein [Sediminibacillus albus]SDK08077.1 hypothetical protein SAMN05216243_1911 [Sediminibacillus albus]